MMQSRKIALCGLLVAAAVVIMILAGAIGIGTYAGPVLAMVILFPVLEEYGSKTAILSYLSTAVLGLLLIPEAEQAAVYAAFGWYPVLRPHLVRIPSRLFRIAAKVALCSCIILLLYGVVLKVLGLTADLAQAAPLFLAVLLVLANITFLIADLALGRLTVLWHRRFRKQFFRSL